MRKFLAGLAVVGTLCLGTGCSSWNDDHGMGDAPVSGKAGDDTASDCINQPDGFSNVCGKCIKDYAPWAIFSTTSGAVVAVQVPEKCGGKAVAGATVVQGDAGRTEEG